MKLETVKDNIIFQFTEDIQAGRFVNSTGGKILVSAVDVAQSSIPRWGHVIEVGPEALDVRAGDFILIEPGKWSNGFYVDDLRYWKTDEQQVMVISDTPHSTY